MREMTLFKLNLIEVIVILVPAIVVFWRFFHVVFETIEMDNRLDDKLAKKMQKDFKKIEKELREYGSSDWREGELESFAKDAWTRYEPKKEQEPMGKKVLLKGYSCEYCNHFVNTDLPVQAELIPEGAWIEKSRFECPECDSSSKTVKNPILWEAPIKKQTTTKEIMDDYNKEAKKLDLPFKLLMFAAIWFAAALIVYGLSFVPWLPILISFWILTKVLTYELTRWYSLIGLTVALLIFYQWHKQAIRDQVDYIQNIRRSRKRYRGMVQRKAEVTEDELKSFVNEVNHTQERERITEKYDGLLKEIDEATVSEEEIPF